MNRPLLLLLGTGAMLGLNFPIGKLALAAGIGAALWAATISLGAGLAMWIVTSLTESRVPRDNQHPHGEVRALGSGHRPAQGQAVRASNHEGSSTHSDVPAASRSFEARRETRPAPQDEGVDGKEVCGHPSPSPPRKGEGSRAALVRYAFISGFLSYVMPNLLTFSAIPKIGSGLAAIMFALSPVTTAALSILLKVRPPSLLGLAGIALGLIGALVIIVFRGSSFSVEATWWLGLALLIPVFLAIGNIYRTLAWPEGASPRRLAAVTNLAAVAPLLLVAVFESGTLDLSPLLVSPGLVALQVAVSSAMFLMFFRLQQIGGPTYLSQIGYVAAAVGVVIGVTWLGESYPPGVWAGTAVIAGGIALATFAQFRGP